MEELRKALRELESSISDLINLKGDENIRTYYLAYAKVAHLKLEHGKNAMDGDAIHWLYESIKTDNYEIPNK